MKVCFSLFDHSCDWSRIQELFKNRQTHKHINTHTQTQKGIFDVSLYFVEKATVVQLPKNIP